MLEEIAELMEMAGALRMLAAEVEEKSPAGYVLGLIAARLEGVADRISVGDGS